MQQTLVPLFAVPPDGDSKHINNRQKNFPQQCTSFCSLHIGWSEWHHQAVAEGRTVPPSLPPPVAKRLPGGQRGKRAPYAPRQPKNQVLPRENLNLFYFFMSYFATSRRLLQNSLKGVGSSTHDLCEFSGSKFAGNFPFLLIFSGIFFPFLGFFFSR